MFDWKHAFEVVTYALDVVHSAGDIPGVNLLPYVSTIANAAGTISAGMKVGAKVAPYVDAIQETFKNGLPTEEKRAALDAKIAELRAIVHAPLPPKEEDEPD